MQIRIHLFHEPGDTRALMQLNIAVTISDDRMNDAVGRSSKTRQSVKEPPTMRKFRVQGTSSKTGQSVKEPPTMREFRVQGRSSKTRQPVKEPPTMREF
ncbi:hypothetical protein RRG08_036298 [Elysia crispata]|uniref:Uncharacterized protein n=1 Tax=Elysia crispata TaxID=231223 RepID=A0AAE1DLI5_9GAST|nr:hypothetical protein RRG08_036298 [Elysia crispata]